MMTQVITTLFTMICPAAGTLADGSHPENVPQSFGTDGSGEARVLAVDYKSIRHTTIREYQDTRGLIEEILTAGNVCPGRGPPRLGSPHETQRTDLVPGRV